MFLNLDMYGPTISEKDIRERQSFVQLRAPQSVPTTQAYPGGHQNQTISSHERYA